VRAVHVLADDARSVLEARVNHHAIALGDPVGSPAERLDDAGAVGSQSSRLRH
jgi:hypothetical protein